MDFYPCVDDVPGLIKKCQERGVPVGDIYFWAYVKDAVLHSPHRSRCFARAPHPLNRLSWKDILTKEYQACRACSGDIIHAEDATQLGSCTLTMAKFLGDVEASEEYFLHQKAGTLDAKKMLKFHDALNTPFYTDSYPNLEVDPGLDPRTFKSLKAAWLGGVDEQTLLFCAATKKVRTERFRDPVEETVNITGRLTAASESIAFLSDPNAIEHISFLESNISKASKVIDYIRFQNLLGGGIYRGNGIRTSFLTMKLLKLYNPSNQRVFKAPTVAVKAIQMESPIITLEFDGKAPSRAWNTFKVLAEDADPTTFTSPQSLASIWETASALEGDN